MSTAAKIAKPTGWFKITGPNGEPINGGSGTWFLPTESRPGKWMPKVKTVVACSSGYHLVKAVGIVEWLPLALKPGILWMAEGRGASDADGSKTAFAQARLIKKVGILDEVSMRLAAADMAERVLPSFGKILPNDDRPAKAIQAARDFALGKIDAAARSVARSAAWSAARSAAESAARSAAWSAARSAAGSAAESVARSAAWSAAESAAWSAAESVARGAAWSAARGAAGRADWSAAWSAAESANAKIIIAQAKRRIAEPPR